MDLLGSAKEYKDRIVNVLIILAAIFIAFKIYSSQGTEIALLNQAREEEKNKNDILKEIEKKDKELQEYTTFINQKDRNSIFNNISDMAKLSAVELISIRPLNEENVSFYIKLNYDLKISSDSYHSIGKFVSLLESAPDIFLVEKIAMSQQTTQAGERRTEKINADLRISTIFIAAKTR
ncbi:MAG: type 4a pilus biogenesis protein PilO [Candidatus Omnitrophota bacterium]